MTRDALESLLKDVTDDDLERLRDAILREEGRRRATFHLTVNEPFPPLARDDQPDALIMRWAKLLTWLAKDTDFPLATGKRGVSITLVYRDRPPDPQEASILLQQAMVEAGLLAGRTAEWVDATVTQLERGEADAVHIQMWEKPVPASFS